ncbi:MAG: M6 family metalloprotease domain-containing protein [Prevotella sp.]|nr:M6 family metalloprotease domain-containing protein [Prevotella sp.]
MRIKFTRLILLSLFPLCAMAQGEEFTIIKGGCMPDLLEDGVNHRASRRLPQRKTDWDADKTYKQMVVLFTFSDQDYTMENPKEYYQRLFNEHGFNQGYGLGCVADYYKEQSGGLVNFEFDIYGPVQVSGKACPTEGVTNYGRTSMQEATQLVLEANPTVDYSQYDWDGNGVIEQVIFVHAGPGGNTGSTAGYIWPNTSSFPGVTTPDGKRIYNYTASAEIWKFSETTPDYCGIGTICHEFSHSLGLPDIYPTSGSLYSAVDEWDLMDGGNFTNRGWCPPNFSPLEKMLMGWLTPVALTEKTTITDMKPIEEGGPVYQIKHTDTEYLLLENRQWTGWDAGIPGKGLVVYYVNYDASVWSVNSVNNVSSEADFRYRLVSADNMTYSEWGDKIKQENLSSYLNDDRMNRRYLSTSPYPYDTNHELTNTSTPAAQMKTKNAGDETLLSKPITNIQMNSEGLISFDFMADNALGIHQVRQMLEEESEVLYTLSGQRVYIPLPGRLYIAKKKDGTARKFIY